MPNNWTGWIHLWLIVAQRRAWRSALALGHLREALPRCLLGRVLVGGLPSWLLSMDALNETHWQCSRLEIYPLRLQTYFALPEAMRDVTVPEWMSALPKTSLLLWELYCLSVQFGSRLPSTGQEVYMTCKRILPVSTCAIQGLSIIHLFVLRFVVVTGSQF